MKRLVFLLLFLGCAGSPASYKVMQTEKFLSLSTQELCQAYRHTRQDLIKEELNRRQAIPEKEWPLIERKEVVIGMTLFGMMCSWGTPAWQGTVYKTIAVSGTEFQVVYRPDFRKTAYVYLFQRRGRHRNQPSLPQSNNDAAALASMTTR